MDVVYLEGLAGDYYEEQPYEVARYQEEFERMSAKAFGPRTTMTIVKRLLASAPGAKESRPQPGDLRRSSSAEG